ncbi:MAG: hypothetical protein K0S11_251 [Gammaproteobacteria bacterium]|jgi:hypothetical protein|nr:hypothetical protein [Gammaproteobacteria bacterium]
MKRFLVAIIGLFIAVPILAKDLNVALTATKIRVVKQQERRGDELYFDIAEYTKDGLQQFYRVPEKPIHLLSSHLDKIKDFKLWHNTLKDGESAQVVVSFIEEDYSPWDLDDLIGVVKLRIKNEGGKLIAHWSMPNTTNKGLLLNQDNKQHRFVLTGSSANYQLDLQLTA